MKIKSILVHSILCFVAVLGIDTPLVGTVKADQWVEITPANAGRSRPALAYNEANGKFYLIGGETTGGDRNIPIEEYDPALGTWVNKINLNVSVSNIGAVAVDGLIYIPGGWDGAIGRTELQIYNPETNVVTLGAPLPTANFAHAVVAFGYDIHVLGGSADGIEGTTHLIYNTLTDSWSDGAPVPYIANYPAATTNGKFIYFMGGRNNAVDSVFVERYEPGTNTWATYTSMTSARGGGLGAYYDGTRIQAVGGGWNTFLDSVEEYDGLFWVSNNSLNVGARTFGLAYGPGYAMKAAGWNGGYLNNVEINDQIFANGLE